MTDTKMPEWVKYIEDFLRDNDLLSLWARDEVRPSLENLISALKCAMEALENYEYTSGRIENPDFPNRIVTKYSSAAEALSKIREGKFE